MTRRQNKSDRRVFLKQAPARVAVAGGLYAMDYSFQCDVAELVATDDLSISDHDKKLMHQLNAERLFSLKRA
jgi:hypothetical protein